MLYSRELLSALTMCGHISIVAPASKDDAVMLATLTAAIKCWQRQVKARGQGGPASTTINHGRVRKKAVVIVRAPKKWRGSTMFGYVYLNGDAVYKSNFRMTAHS